MNVVSFQQIIKTIDKAPSSGVYFFQGEEASYYMNQFIKYITNTQRAKSSYSLRTYHAKQSTLEEVIIDAQQQSIGQEKKVIIVKEAEKLLTLRKPSGKKMLLTYLQHLSNPNLLLFAYNDKPLLASSALAKLLMAQKRMFTCKKLYTNQLPEFIQHYIIARGYNITSKAIAILQEIASNRLQVLTHELDKLLINLPKGDTLQEGHITTYIESSKEYTLYDLQQALSIRDSERIYVIVHSLIQNKKKYPLPYIIVYLTNFYAKLLKLQHNPSRDRRLIATKLKIQPYLVDLYLHAYRHYSLSQTLQCITSLHEADLQFKGINYPTMVEEDIFNELVAKLITPYILPSVPQSFFPLL